MIETSRCFLHGDGVDRWLDKSFSLLVSANGRAALNFEHAWGDGVAVLRFFNETYAAAAALPTVGAADAPIAHTRVERRGACRRTSIVGPRAPGATRDSLRTDRISSHERERFRTLPNASERQSLSESSSSPPKPWKPPDSINKIEEEDVSRHKEANAPKKDPLEDLRDDHLKPETRQRRQRVGRRQSTYQWSSYLA